MVQSAVLDIDQSVARSVEDYAFWTLAHEVVTARDTADTREHIGSGATESRLFDTIHIVGPDGQPLYTFLSGASPGTDSLDAKAISPFLTALAGRAIGDYPTISGVAMVGGHASLLSAAHITPDDFDSRGTDRPVILIGIIHLSDARLAIMAQDRFLGRISVTPGLDDAPARVVLTDLSGQAVATLTWAPPQPEQELLARDMPPILMVSLLLLTCTVIIGRTVGRQDRALRRAATAATTDALTGLLNSAGLTALMETAQMAAAPSATGVLGWSPTATWQSRRPRPGGRRRCA